MCSLSAATLKPARLSGINIRFTIYGVYAFSALASSIAGILYTSRLANGIPTAGKGYELDAIAAAVVGGASLMGGEGTILGMVRVRCSSPPYETAGTFSESIPLSCRSQSAG
jgi:ABC-type xylose transport system permease subunit